ncbi:MAG TPA: cation:proton antiporter [Candidatus Binatia bacterium]|nr:cation:proton antiporter [Candidatus Binatia bacterium]
MAEAPLLRDLVVLFATAIPIVFIFHRLNVPSIVGFLIAGVLIGPNGLGLIKGADDVERLAELGVVLLLFVVGLELSLEQLTQLGRTVVTAAALQVLLTAALTTALMSAAGLPTAQAIFIGFVVVHSSTAVALKLLADRGEIDSAHGRLTAGIAVIQDLCVVPMMLLVPVLAHPSAASPLAITLTIAKAAVLVAVIIVAARMLLPRLLELIVRLRIRELLTGAVVLFCLGTAWLTAQFGLSLAFGALVAGLVISESEYSHQAVAEILPFRDTFNSIFFTSVGMLLHLDVVVQHAAALLGLTVAAILLKGVLIGTVIGALTGSARLAALVAAALCQIGELAFVLARLATSSPLLSSLHYDLFLAVSVVSMAATPFLLHAAPSIAHLLQRTRGQRPEPLRPKDELHGHVVIIGYGLNGRNLARVLRETGLRYRILELNPDVVAGARRDQEPIIFGDATRADLLHRVHIEHAHVVVVAISDAAATRRIVAVIRQLNPHATVIVRTRYVAEIDTLYRLGATEVIPEEFETSVEIFARVLRRLRIPRNVINVQIDLIRGERYGMLRGLTLPRQSMHDIQHLLAATLTETYLVDPSSVAAGRTIADLGLRRATGVTIIATVRGGTPVTNPGPEHRIEAGDTLVLLGNHNELDRAMARLEPKRAAGEDSP